jgi:Spy/CpxP family protein refolding chaperone
MRRTIGVVSVVMLLASAASAEEGRHVRHKGLGLGHCGIALLRGHPDVLKARFNLTDAQINKLKPLRLAFLTKQIQTKADIAKLGLQMKTLFEGDLPDTKKVLDVYRKIRNLTNQIGEERIKLQLTFLGSLTKEQRAKLRLQCPMKGLGMGMHGHHDKGDKGDKGGHHDKDKDKDKDKGGHHKDKSH